MTHAVPHSEQILALLKGCTSHKPMRGDDLLKHLGPDADPDQINDVLNDLQGRGALCRVEISKGGETYTALWPTGLVPRHLSWKDERDNGRGLMGAQLAHNVQQAAEQSRQPKPIPHSPSPIAKEKPMTRIARPAQIVEKVHETNRPHNLTRNGGAVQQAVLDVLRNSPIALDVETIFAGCKVRTSVGSVGKTLETLAKRGEVVPSLRFHNHRNRRFYMIAGVEESAAHAEPLCSELPGNLRTLRRIGADDDGRAAASPILPDATTAVPAAQTTSDQQHTRAAAVAGLETDAPRFALWDNGALLLTVGEEIIALPRADAQRLADYLRGVSEVLFAEAV